MRTVNYNFNGETQERIVYTKAEIAYALWNTVAISDKEVLVHKVADNRKL